MRIDEQTKYADFQPIEDAIADDEKQKIKAAAEQYFKPCYTLTIDEFFGLLNGDYSLLGSMAEPSVLQVYWLKRFAEFCEEFTNACARMNIKDPEKEHLHTGCVSIEPQEAMLIFTREYFGLPSFFAAGERTIGEYLTARKDKFNEAVVRHNFEAEQKRKFKMKK